MRNSADVVENGLYVVPDTLFIAEVQDETFDRFVTEEANELKLTLRLQVAGLAVSPGDLDEGVAVLLSFRTESDRDRQGPGFVRVKAFRAGVIRGPEVCADIEAP